MNYFVKPSMTDQGAARAVDDFTCGPQSLKEIVDWIGTTNQATIVFESTETAATTYTLTTSETTPSNISVKIWPGAVLDGAGTLTIQGNLDAGDYKIFGSSITVAFAVTSQFDVLASWWGYSTSETGANNDTYFEAAVASMAAGQRLITGQGNHLIETPMFNPPDGCSWLNLGILESNGYVGTAIRIGDALAASTYVMRYNIQNLKVASTTKDHSSGRVGVLIYNVMESYIDIRQCDGFEYGVKLQGYGTGVQFNEIHLGKIYDNKYSVNLYADNSGWVNENEIYGGRLGWSSAQDTAGYIHILINHYVTNPINNNKFFGPALEATASTGLDTAVGISCEGWNNYFYSPRFELDAANGLATFSANSVDNVIFFGYGMVGVVGITDNGAQNKLFGKNVLSFKGAVVSSTSGALQVANVSTESTSPGISVHGTDGVSNVQIYGDGDINTATHYEVAGTQVVRAQGAAVADATDAASVILRLNDLLARLRTHGLIAT